MKNGWGFTTTFEEWICLSIGIVSFLLLIPIFFSTRVID
jgi:DMSO/TMAO reductase YedYZ heme-binding membrane subunit